MKSKNAKKIKRRSKRMLNDNSQAGPLAIQDSQDFLEGDFSTDVVLASSASLRSSGYRHRRQKNGPFEETMERIHMIAGITSSIYIQGALFNGTIEPKKLISEMLLFNPVTPDQINALDYAKFEVPLNQLKELPGKLETGGKIKELETFFDLVRQVLELMKGVENVEKWPDQEDFKKDFGSMQTNGGEMKFATDVYQLLQHWLIFQSDIKQKKATANFDFVKAFIDDTKNILEAGEASEPLPEVFTFSNKKTPSQSVEFLKKVIKAGKFIDSSGMSRPTEGYNELTNKVKDVNDTLASLRDIQALLAQIENFFKSRALSWNLPPIKYTAGLPKGLKDVRQMLNELEQNWSLAIVKGKYLLESLASIKSLDNKFSEIDMVLGVGAETFAETLSKIIQTFSLLEETFSSFKKEIAEEVVKCFDNPNQKVKDAELNEFIASATDVENEIGKLKNGSEELKKYLTNKEGRNCLTALVTAFGNPDENNPAETTTAMDNVLNSESLEGAKNFVDALSKKAQNIKNDDLKAKAESALKKLDSVDTFVKAHENEHLKVLQCFIEKKKTGSTVDIINEMKSIRSAQHEYGDMVDKGLEGVKKVVGIKDKLTALEKTITGLKGKNPASQKLLNMLVDPEKHSNIIGHSTRGVLNMKRALEANPSSYFKKHEKFVETETNKHSKVLSKAQVDILKKYSAISTELDALHPKLTDFFGKFSSKNMVNVTDFSGIFTHAKDVPGITLDFGQMVEALDVLIEEETPKSNGEKTLVDIRKNLVGLSSIGLDFKSYHQYFDKYKDSAQDLDLFFANLNTAASMTTLSPILQNQNAANQNGKNADVVPWYSEPKYYGPISGGCFVGVLIGSGIAIFLILRRLKKKNKEDDEDIENRDVDVVFAYFICVPRRAIEFILCLFGKLVNYAFKELRYEYPEKDEFFEKLNLEEEVKKIEDARKNAGADLPNTPGPVNLPEPLIENPQLPDAAAPLAPVAEKKKEEKKKTPAQIRGETFFKYTHTLHYAVVSDHKPESFEVWKHTNESRHSVALSPENRIILPTKNSGEDPNKKGSKKPSKKPKKSSKKPKKSSKTPKKSSKKTEKKSNEEPSKSSTKTFATDFFHGNYVQLNNGWKTHLVQAPLVNTEGKVPNVDKFYFLVKDRKIKAVVMLCDFEETSYLTPGEIGRKAEEYFPAEKDKEMPFEGFKVKCTALSKEGNITTRTLQLKYDGETEVYEFTHYHYTGWPDHSAPEDPTEVVKLLMTVRKIEKVLIHCSAGIGRTGSFVYAEMIYQEIATLVKNDGEIDFGGRLRWLRTKRAESVQEPIQFAFSLLVVVFMLFYDVQDLHPSIAKFRQYFLESYQYALVDFKKEGKENYDKKEAEKKAKKAKKAKIEAEKKAEAEAEAKNKT